jgi:hypothetical protein
MGDTFVARVVLAMTADAYTISEPGGTVELYLNASIDFANWNYLLLGSISGTEPGTLLPGGRVTLPLNWDLFTNIVINMVNGPIFQNFMGKLDMNGTATATLNLPPVPGAAGLTLYFAYALKPYDFASNPVAIDIVP